MTHPVPNRIPADVFVAVTRPLLDAFEVHSTNPRNRETPSAVTLIAERCNVRADTLHKVYDGDVQTIDFDLADDILCKLWAFDLWWEDERLRPYYYGEQTAVHDRVFAVERSVHRCQRPGCSNWWRDGRKGKLYCGESCAARASALRRGIRPSPGESSQRKRDGTGGYVCRNGHERTPENTRIVQKLDKKRNKVYESRVCRVCEREMATKLYREGRSARSSIVKKRHRAKAAA